MSLPFFFRALFKYRYKRRDDESQDECILVCVRTVARTQQTILFTFSRKKEKYNNKWQSVYLNVRSQLLN